MELLINVLLVVAIITTLMVMIATIKTFNKRRESEKRVDAEFKMKMEKAESILQAIQRQIEEGCDECIPEAPDSNKKIDKLERRLELLQDHLNLEYYEIRNEEIAEDIDGINKHEASIERGYRKIKKNNK